MASIFSKVRKAYQAAARAFSDLEPVDASSRGWRTVFDWRPGAWQQDDPFISSGDRSDTMQSAVVYACIRLLAWDIAKLPAKVMRLVAGIWEEADHQTFAALLRKPNYFQGWIDFILSWLFSYLLAGNAYILKLRTPGRGVTGLMVLDPSLVQPMVDQVSGVIVYRLGQDPLTPIAADDTLVLASEIIHHRYMAFGHPLIGTSVLVRAQQAARLRNGTMESNAELATNNAVPPGILIAPEGLTDEDLQKIRVKWEAQGKGRIAVVDAAFKFESLQSKFIDSQSKEFAELAAVDICIACGVPPWKVGVGARPPGLDVEAANIIYYQDSLQLPIEHIEQLLDDGLDVPRDVYICLDRYELFLLDSKTRAELDKLLVGGGVKAPNEARRGWNLPPVKGGETPYLQQQNYSLSALAARDSAAPAPSSAAPPPGGGSGGQAPETSKEEGDKTAARKPSTLLPWAGVWRADGEYPEGFVTHKGSLWARVWRPEAVLGGTVETHRAYDQGEETGAEPGTDAGRLYWALAVKRGEAPTENT